MQGPHQVAQKSNTTHLPRNEESVNVLPLMSKRVKSGVVASVPTAPILLVVSFCCFLSLFSFWVSIFWNITENGELRTSSLIISAYSIISSNEPVPESRYADISLSGCFLKFLPSGGVEPRPYAHLIKFVVCLCYIIIFITNDMFIIIALLYFTPKTIIIFICNFYR